MPVPLTPSLDDHECAAVLAARAGALLVQLRRGELRGRSLGDAGDQQANDLLLEGLAALRPQDAVLSEESADDLSRLTAPRVWIVDPLDGTNEYREPGRVDWAVHVALWQHGSLVAGAVALPARGIVLRSDHPPVRRLEAGDRGALRLVVSRSRPPAIAARIAGVLGAVTVAMGSAGAKAAAVILGEADAYLHATGQFEWDSAAPVAVAAAAGLHSSRLDGRPLVYNRADVSLPDLLICRRDLARPIIEEVMHSRRTGTLQGP